MRATAVNSIAPDRARYFDDAGELGALHRLIDGDVAGGAGREAALRAERELVEIDRAARLLDAAHEGVGGLELRDLGGDEPEHDSLSRRHRAQRLEAARAGARKSTRL